MKKYTFFILSCFFSVGYVWSVETDTFADDDVEIFSGENSVDSHTNFGEYDGCFVQKGPGVKGFATGSIEEALSGEFLFSNVFEGYDERKVVIDERHLTDVQASEITKKLEKIVKYGPSERDISAVDAQGRILLHEAALRRDSAAIEVLVKNGAYVNCLSDDNQTPLFEILLGTRIVSRYILLKEFDRQKSFIKISLLEKEALDELEAHMIEAIKILLDNGADVYAKDMDGRTLLYRTIQRGLDKVALFLIPFLANDMDALKFALGQGKYDLALAIRKTLRQQKSHVLYDANVLLKNCVPFKRFALLDYYKSLCAAGESIDATISVHLADYKSSELSAEESGHLSNFRKTLTCKEFLKS